MLTCCLVGLLNNSLNNERLASGHASPCGTCFWGLSVVRAGR